MARWGGGLFAEARKMIVELKVLLPIRLLAEGVEDEDGEFLNISFEEKEIIEQVNLFIEYIKSSKEMKASLLKFEENKNDSTI